MHKIFSTSVLINILQQIFGYAHKTLNMYISVQVLKLVVM